MKLPQSLTQSMNRHFLLCLIYTSAFWSLSHNLNAAKSPDYPTQLLRQYDSLLFISMYSNEDDTTRLKALVDLSELFAPFTADSIIPFAKKAISFGESLRSSSYAPVDNPLTQKVLQREMGYAYLNIGYAHEQLGNVSQGLRNYEKGMVLLEETNDSKGIQIALNNIANVYTHMGYLAQALTAFERALVLSRQLGDTLHMSHIFNNIGNLYFSNKNYDQALEYFNQAYELRNKINNLRALANSHNNLGALYLETGEMIPALSHFNEALLLREELKDPVGRSISMANIGSYYFKQNNLDIAKSYFNESLKLSRENRYLSGEVATMIKLTELYEAEKDTLQILAYAEAGLQKAISLEYADRIVMLAESLISIYRAQNNWKKAYEIQSLMSKYSSLLSKKDNQKAITKHQFDMEQLKYDQQLKEQAFIALQARTRRDNLQYLIAFILIIALLSIGSVIIKSNFSKQVSTGLIYLAFLLLFEFLLILSDPYVEDYSAGIPLIKLSINVLLALIILPIHNYSMRLYHQRLMLGVHR